MNIPPSRLSKAFLETDKIPSKIIATPISGIYNEIKGRCNAEERKRGWWDNFTYRTNSGQEVMIVNSHQGNTIVDTTLIANDLCDYFMFLGYCGGFHPDMKVGDITIATQSYFEGKDEVYKSKADMSKLKRMFPNSILGANITIESVIREAEAIKSRRPGYLKEGTVSADQETAYIYRDSKIPSASVMVVSDLPLKERGIVFELDHSDLKQIESGVKSLTDDVLKFIDLL